MKNRFLKIMAVAVCLALAAGAGAKNIKHPSLLFTPDRVEAAKKRMATDTVQAAAYDHIISTAEGLLQRNDVRKMEYLALAYQLTGDKRYADKLRTMLLDVAKTESWADREMMMRNPPWRSELQMAHRAYQLAIAYDVIYNTLSAADRKTIAEGLYRLAVEPLLGDWLLEPTRIHSLNSMGHNWWSSCVGMGGLLALAISNEVPEAAAGAQAAVEALPEWFWFAGDVLQHKPCTFDRDGGMYESVNYASFGISEALLLRLAWLNSHPGEKLEELPQMAQLADFFIQVGYPRSEGIFYSINLGDSHKNVTGERCLIPAYAMGAENPDILWYVNQLTPGQHGEGMLRPEPMGFLYMPDLSKAPETPSTPLDRIWHDFGWATLRNSYQPDATMLTAKSGMTWNHAHADAGSLILFHKGEDIIKDAGNCSYGKPEYRQYFFQSDAHNVVKLNGRGQSAYQQYHGTMLPGTMSDLISGKTLKYVLADATGPTSDLFARNFRHYLWVDDVILVIDDLKSHENGQYEWLWHPGGETVKRGGDLEITKNRSAVVVRPLFPEPLAPSGYVHDYPELMYWDVLEGPKEDLSGKENYYSIKLPGEFNRIKGITAILLKDSPEQKNVASTRRLKGDGWIGLEITGLDGKVTRVYVNELADGRTMHLNSWISPEGYETDAYMLVVSPGRTFVCYGSSLRKDGKSIFSSLSKLNMLAEEADGVLDLTVEGQPRINAVYRPEKQPSKVILNGKETKLPLKNGALQIKKTL